MDLKDTLVRLLGLEKVVAHLTGFVTSRVALLRLEVRDEVAHLVSKGLVAVVILFFAFLFILFASLAAAQVINTAVGHEYAGYVWVAAFYFFLGLIFFVARKPLQSVLETRLKAFVKRDERKSE
jgi:uncharacterized membrane protein YqjE